MVDEVDKFDRIDKIDNIHRAEWYEEQSEGFSPAAWDRTRYIEEEVILTDRIAEDYALRVVLIPEKIDMDMIKNEQLRKFAAHNEFWDAEYFPYVLYKANGARRVLKVKDFNGAFTLPSLFPRDPITGETDLSWKDKVPRFQLSRRIYEMRTSLETTPDFLRKFGEVEVDGRRLFEEVKARILFHLDVEEWVATVMALWIMGTHVYQLFESYAYIYLLAQHGSGKTRALKIIKLLSRLGQLWVSPRPSPLFRSVHALQPTIAIDEVEKLNDDDMAELLALLNAGYERGAVVPRTNVDKMVAEFFNAYCPKAIATTKPISMVLESRCIRIPIRRTADQTRSEREPINEKYKWMLDELREELEIWAIDQGPEIARLDTDKVIEKYRALFDGVPPRTLQILTPLLMIYEALGLAEKAPTGLDMESQELLWTDEVENLRKALEHQMEESKSSSVIDSDERILVALYRCVMEGESAITIKAIKGALNLEEEEEMKYYTPQKIGKVLRNFNIPGRTINGRRRYMDKMTLSDRQVCIEDLLKRYSITIDSIEQESRPQASRDVDEWEVYQ